MDANIPFQVMLPAPQAHQHQYKQAPQMEPPTAPNGSIQVLSVDKALQFTPLTTSVLPAYDRIPIPQISRAKESAKLTSSSERKNMQQTLSQCSALKIKTKLQALLRPDLLPEFKFKRGLSVEHASDRSEHNLSATAKMVLEATAIDYKYPDTTRIGAKPQVLVETKNVSQLPKPKMPKQSPNQQTKSNHVLPGPNGHMPWITKPTSQSISINLPQVPGQPQFDNKNIKTDTPLVEKPAHSEPVVQLSLHVRSQKDAANAALQQFQNLLLEVFEAQDQIDAGSVAPFEAGYFEQAQESDDSESRLSNKIMDKLLAGLKKLISMKILSDMSNDHLIRLQRLCEPSIDRVQTLNLKIQTDADPDEQRSLRQHIRDAETGLLAASVCLHTVLGHNPDESLFATDALPWIASALGNVFETCLVPCIEARPDDATSDFFKLATAYRDDLKRLLEGGRKVLDFVSTACTQTRGLDSSVNPIEFLAAKLIFVQNASTDKSSVLGIQTFEKVRKTAMSSLARIFARFPAERSAILDEVLTSLDKLPSNSRSARQYRLGDGKSMQLISALFMQLVQNTALETTNSHSATQKNATSKRLQSLNGHDVDDPDAMQLVNDDDQGTDADLGDALTRLQKKGNNLFDVAAKSAQEIVLYLVSRASKTTKTGDSPYRNVLDLFIEDMVTVLALPEWPSSELMLRIMAAKMTDIAQNEKTASAKNMALECLGVMGSAISTLKASLPRQRAFLSREGKSKSETTEQLSRLAADQDQGGVRNEDLIAFNGPFAIVSRHLWTEADQGLRHLSACGFFLAQYAKVMTLIVDAKTFDESNIESEPVRVANFLLDSIAQIGAGATNTHNFDVIFPEEAELAYTISVLNMGFCRRFSAIVKTLSSSFSSDQAQVRSRSLKSVVTMLETDSTLLDHDPSIADDVFKCAADESAMVRDSALSLIAKFIISRPALEQKGIQRLLECASDAKVGVQKRAIGHLKDIYIKDSRPNLKATISRVILQRTGDHEDTVVELAKKTLNEIWITPALTQLSHAGDLAKTRVTIEDLTKDIISCIAYDPNTLCSLFKKYLKTLLTTDAKTGGKARDLCSRIIEVLFEKVISSEDEKNPLTVLMSFAEADAQLIPPSNLVKLQPYLSNLKTENDLFVFKAVISIFSYVLPHLSAVHKPLLQDTQNALMKAISSLGRRAELDTVMSCLQVIDGVLQNTMRLIKLASSIMLKIRSGVATLPTAQDSMPQLLKLVRIAGAMGRYIDLEKYWQQFANEVKGMKGRSVAGYMASTLLLLTPKDQPLKIRLLALESIGSICQAFPAQLNEKPIIETFFKVLATDTSAEDATENYSMQGVVLKAFDELYAQRAQDKEVEDGKDEETEKQELGKMGGDTRTRDGDSAISMVTGNIAKCAFSIALSSVNENALLATRVLANISHQGLNHPKHSLLAFVALSTCPDDRIASVAHEAHRFLHQQHASVCDREYMSAIHQAFDYQRKVLDDPRGARPPNFRAKLAHCFEVVNNTSSKSVKKFLSGLVSRVSAKLSTDDGVMSADQVLWTLFAIQNLAFFEFGKVDEVLHAILQLELAFSKKGVEISQLLEAALAAPPVSANLVQVDTQVDFPVTDVVDNAKAKENAAVIQQLAPLAATLTIMIEGRSHLKRQYGVGRDVRTAISNSKQTKDTAKAPTKVHGVTGEKFWTKSNAVVELLQDDAGRVSCCQNFVTLMSMDDDINVDEDDRWRDVSEDVGPSEAHVPVRGSTPGISGVKRKLSASASSTPAKRAPGRPRKDSRRSTSISSADDFDADFAG